MHHLINSKEIEILIHESNGLFVGMTQSSLETHMKKHPEIARTPEGYLETAAFVLRNGTPYKNGKIYKGIFAGSYIHPELDCEMVITVHQKQSK